MGSFPFPVGDRGVPATDWRRESEYIRFLHDSQIKLLSGSGANLGTIVGGDFGRWLASFSPFSLFVAKADSFKPVPGFGSVCRGRTE
jgi:hypothetical protein